MLPGTANRVLLLCAALLCTILLIALPTSGAIAASGSVARVITTDLCVYGGTPAGIMAAVQMRRMGHTAVIAEPGKHLGGMSSGGLGATDIGNAEAIGGISREFYNRVADHYATVYGKDSAQFKACRGGFRFEPHIAERFFNEFVAEAQVPVYYGQRLQEVRTRSRIHEIRMEDGTVYRARMYVDATYEGDLMAMAGVTFTIGREGNWKYEETLNGVQFGRGSHNFRVPIDPFRKPGDPASGLLKGISPFDPGVQNEGDDHVQAYNFRMCLTKDPVLRMPFPRPRGYDPARYTILARYIEAGVWDALNSSIPMPNGKTDTNNCGAFSTDNIGMNYEWPAADWKTRERIFREHLTYQQGMMWFLCHDPRVPKDIRDAVNQWGLCRDEFTDYGGWSPQLYVREGRRMVSDYVMTEHNCRGAAKPLDSIGLAAYTMDSHHNQRVVKDGRVVNEGDVQVGGFPPYPISYRAIVPRFSECRNLFVPVCLSSSHISYGSIRMEPVFMVLGQSAGTAAALALEDDVWVQRVDMNKLQARLRADRQILEWTKLAAPAPVLEAPAIAASSLKGVALDDRDGVKQGQWTSSNMAAGRRLGVGYIHDGDINKGSCSISYTPELAADGEYEILVLGPPHANRATNVPVTIKVEGRPDVTVHINQKISTTDGFFSVGKFNLPAGKATTVTISNRDTDGFVVADGIQFLPVGR